MHAAKGLEWPVVFCPFLWMRKQAKATDPAVHHPEPGVLAVDFRPDADRAAAGRESQADDLRLAYVALTRARAATYVAFGPIGRGAQEPRTSSLAHLWGLGGLEPDAWHARLAALTEKSGGRWEFQSEVGREPSEVRSPKSEVDVGPPRSPELRPDERGGDRGSSQSVRRGSSDFFPTWIGTSFSALTAGHETRDERADPAGAGTEDDGPAGPQFGVAVHAAFEKADFGAGSWQELADRCLRDQGILAEDAAARAAEAARIDGWMRAALTVPIPGFAATLAQVPRERRLVEWRFRLARGAVDPRRLAAVLAQHGYAEDAPGIAALPAPTVAAALTGTIDLLCEIDGGWLVVDWKTNRLGDGDLSRLMRGHHYVLQALLYLVAVRRHLGRCAPGARIHGAAYAFLRGLPAGWWTTRPTPACLAALDEAVR
jgi:exodeoxyribonuclease V beta subunit